MTADELRAALLERKWTRVDLARLINQSESLIGKWANGKKAIPTDQEPRILAVLAGDQAPPLMPRYAAIRRVTKDCEECGDEFTRSWHRGDREPRFCSQLCANRHAAKISAERARTLNAKAVEARARKAAAKPKPVEPIVKPMIVVNTGWTPNGHPLCEGAHWSEEVDRHGAYSTFRCVRCGATRELSNVPETLHPWRPRRDKSREVEVLEVG